MTKLELEDGAGAAPTGSNRTTFAASNASTSTERPKLVITYTPAAAPLNTNLKFTGSSLKILGGNLKLKGN